MKNNEDEDSQIESYLLAGSIPTGVDVGNIFKKVLLRIASADLTLSGNACKLVETSVETSAEHQNLLTIMFSESSKFATADKNVYLRFANIWARLLAKSEDLFESCRSCGAVDAIISMCRCSQDVLVQVVTMELLTEFAKTSSGLQFLFNNGTIDWLVGVPSSEDDATFLGNQALRQLGDIFLTAASKSLMTEDFWSAIDKSLIAKYLHTAQTYLENRSESDRLTGLYTLASFSSSCEGALDAMLADQPLSDSYFDLLNSGKVEIVTAALFSIARIIEMEPTQSSGSAAASATSAASISRGAAESKSSDAETAQTITRTSDLCELKKKVVAEMGKARRVSAALFLIKTARQPVIERKLAVYSVLTAICKQQPGGWGLMALFGAAGFREFLEDRNTEHTKEGKDAKFSLIEAVANCPQFSFLMSEDVVSAINKMIVQGAYYKPAAMEDPMVLEL